MMTLIQGISVAVAAGQWLGRPSMGEPIIPAADQTFTTPDGGVWVPNTAALEAEDWELVVPWPAAPASSG